MTDLLSAYFHPDRHAVEIPIYSIVTDDKVDEGYVSEMECRIEDLDRIRPIVVIKHPRENIYAVLDGHHRLQVHRRMGAETIRAAVVDDYIGLGFKLTAEGRFQPSARFTRQVRVPVKRFISQMETFLKDPKGMLRKQLETTRGRLQEAQERLVNRRG